jgi:Tol biopolymer transport system component
MIGTRTGYRWKPSRWHVWSESRLLGWGTLRPSAPEDGTLPTLMTAGRTGWLLALTLVFSAAFPRALLAAGPWRVTERANISSSGAQDNGGVASSIGVFHGSSAISADGRFVAFSSQGDNLVAGDTNGVVDVFVRDRQTGQTSRVSVASDGSQANHVSYGPRMSADGRFVAFISMASNLVPGDTNGFADVFVHDRANGQTTRINVAATGTQANGESISVDISADGRFVAFDSFATNLVPGDTNGVSDVFVYDRLTRDIESVSIGTSVAAAAHDPLISADGQTVAYRASGGLGTDTHIFVYNRHTGQTTQVLGLNASAPDSRVLLDGISADGHLISFASAATNLVRGDTNKEFDCFVHDVVSGQNTRASLADDGSQANGGSERCVISGNGRFVTFSSLATNLTGRFVTRLKGAPICVAECDTNHAADQFVRDLQSGQTFAVTDLTRSGAGLEDGIGKGTAINYTGQYIVFIASGIHLPEDTNKTWDAYIAGPPRYTQPGPPGTKFGTKFSPPTAVKRVVNAPPGGTVAAGEAIDYRIEVTATSPVREPVVVEDTPLNGTVTVLGTSQAFAGCTSAALTGAGCTAPNLPPGTEFIAVRLNVSENCLSAGNSARVFVAGEPIEITNPADFAADMTLAQCVPIPWHTVERASVSSVGSQGDDLSDTPAISSDGRFVTFRSYASNLVPGDTNGSADIFLRDRMRGQTTRVSVSTSGVQSNRDSLFSSVNRDGTIVAFDSAADTLVQNDTVLCGGVASCQDVFVRDVPNNHTTMASISPDGEPGLGNSVWPSLSSDGRFVAFVSAAGNLVPGDTNGIGDVFVRDLALAQTTRVSVSSTGAEIDPASQLWNLSRISADGRYVAFASDATALVPGKTNGVMDIFVHDRLTGVTTRVSLTQSGTEANGDSTNLAISGNGRFVVFESEADNLVPGDTNGQPDIFVHDRDFDGNGVFDEPGGVWTERVSVATGGAQANDESQDPSISEDGRFVAFQSLATNLVADDTNGARDVFVRDRQTGQTVRVTAWDGSEPNGASVFTPQLSGDGCYLAFTSRATNLVPAPGAVLRQEVFVASRCQ